MKKICIALLATLLAVGGATAQNKTTQSKPAQGKATQAKSAQGRTGQGKKKDTPAMAGRQKIRQSDYATYDRFTSFSTKDTNRYYTPFDYSRMADLTRQKKPDWGELQPVMNYLEKVSRATMTMCFIYAVNPDIVESGEHDRLANQAAAEALKATEDFEKWKQGMGWRNKIQYKVAEIDYRYFKGAAYADEPASGDIIRVGALLYFGSKKKAVVSVDQNSRTFPDIKFFPNDATIVDSWDALLDDLSDYLKENDRKGVLLTGHADNSGTEAYSLGLSRQRAVEVKKALQRRGIDASRIEVEARGDAEPVGDNSTYEGRVMNNRVCIKIQ